MDPITAALSDPLLRNSEGYLNISIKDARKMRLMLTAASLFRTLSSDDAVDMAFHLETMIDQRLEEEEKNGKHTGKDSQ